MRKLLVCLAATGCAVMFGTVANAQCGSLVGVECLLNPNLDTGTAGVPPDPGTAPPWSLVNTGNATAAIFNPGFSNSFAAGGNGIWYRSFLGTVAAPVDAVLSQSVVAASTGTYRLTFDYLVETNFTADGMLASLTSSGGGSSSLNLLTVPRTNVGGGFSAQPAAVGSLLLNATAGQTLTVSLAMDNGRGGVTNPQSLVADRFSLRLIPEPASALLVGLALVGLIGIRRRMS